MRMIRCFYILDLQAQCPVCPLHEEVDHTVAVVWYADDASAGGTVISGIFPWWEKLVKYAPQFGNFPKASKSSVIGKAVLKWRFLRSFMTDLIGTLEGRLHLRIHLGTTDYQNQCIKVQEWCRWVEIQITCCFPHFCTWCQKWVDVFLWGCFLYLVTNWYLWKSFLQSLVGTQLLRKKGTFVHFQSDMRAWGIPIPHRISSEQWSLSWKICAPLVEAVLTSSRCWVLTQHISMLTTSLWLYTCRWRRKPCWCRPQWNVSH